MAPVPSRTFYSSRMFQLIPQRTSCSFVMVKPGRNQYQSTMDGFKQSYCCDVKRLSPSKRAHGTQSSALLVCSPDSEHVDFLKTALAERRDPRC